MATQPIQVASTNFRRTSAGVSLGRQLFTNQALQISPTAITSALRAAGVNVPKGVQVSADIAQIIMAGGALISAVDKAENIKSIVFPSAAVIGAASDLLVQSGLMKSDSPAAQVLTLGTDVAMVLATSGTNVLADIKLVSDVALMAFSNPSAQVSAMAQGQLASYLASRRKAQVNALAVNFKDYHQGVISGFDLMAKVAEESPDYLYNYFPEAKAFIPPIILTASVTASGGNVFTGHVDYTARKDIVTTINQDHSFVAGKIYRHFISGPFDIFKRFQALGYPMEKFALLSMFPPYIEFLTPSLDIKMALKNLQLTPNDFEDPYVQNQVIAQSNAEPDYPSISLNGVDFIQYQKDLASKKLVLNTAYKNISDGDLNGNISKILKYPQGQKIIDDWGNHAYYDSWFKATDPSRKPDHVNYGSLSYNLDPWDSNPPYYVKDSFNLRNYWSAVAMVDKLKNDSYFKEEQSKLGSFDFMGTSKKLQDKLKNLQFKSTCRQLNIQALKNVGFYLGKNPADLKMITKPTDKLTMFQ